MRPRSRSIIGPVCLHTITLTDVLPPIYAGDDFSADGRESLSHAGTRSAAAPRRHRFVSSYSFRDGRRDFDFATPGMPPPIIRIILRSLTLSAGGHLATIQQISHSDLLSLDTDMALVTATCHGTPFAIFRRLGAIFTPMMITHTGVIFTGAEISENHGTRDDEKPS